MPWLANNEVTIDLPGGIEVVSIITKNSAERLALAPSKEVHAVIRATNVMVAPFAQVMPDEYRREDAVEAYRAFYRGAKARLARWTRRPVPDWWWEGTDTPGSPGAFETPGPTVLNGSHG